ncbi:MAG: hypothetical protein IJG52_02205 [Lachnospiraceae bacterium]|nr:hypothetical protein [Lachnospiraceae bacterium]
MSEGKPIFIIKKYRSILWAAVVVESVSFIVSLTDGIVAGNLIGLRALEGVTIFAINVFAVSSFDAVTLVVLIMVEKYLGLLTLFIGLSMAAQPLIGTLMGENNTKALRIVSSTLVLQALLVLFFIYYYLIGRQRLAFEICVIKNVISPLFLSVLFSVLTGSHVGLWFGLGCAPLLSILICSQLIYWRFSKKHSLGFPFLLPREADDDIYIYDFALTEANAVEMSHTADAVLAGRSASEKNRMLASLFLEEMLLLIREKNKGAKVNAESSNIPPRRSAGAASLRPRLPAQTP